MAGTTNFVQVDTGKKNIMDDTTYGANSQRLNGFALDDLVPSVLLNKMLYQPTTFCAAMGQMLANKGYSTSDSDINALATALAVLLTQADFAFVTKIVSIPWSATPVFDASQSWQFYMLLTGNVTSSTLSNTSPGQKITFCWQQDSVGNRTIVYPSNVHSWGAPMPTANYVTTQVFEVLPSGILYPASPPASGV